VILEGKAGTGAQIDVNVVERDGTETTLAPLVLTLARPAAFDADAERVRVLIERIRAVERRSPTADAPALRIAVFTHQLGLGGGQLYLQELLLALLLDDSVSCLVVSGADGPLRADLERAGAIVHVTQYPTWSDTEYAARQLELAHLVRAHDANVVLVNTMNAGIGADLARQLDLPAVWAIHESFQLVEYWVAAYGENGIHPDVKTSVTDALRAATAVVFEAERTRSAYLGVGDDRRLVMVPYGIDLAGIDAFLASSDRASVRRDLGLAEREMAIVSVATFEGRKAQAALVLAFAELAVDFPDAVLVLVGANASPYADAVREVVRRSGLADRVRLKGVTPRVYEWYLACDAFVLPSDVESMPRSLLEVMAFGRPVAASSAWGVPELVRDNENGLLFEPRDFDALTRALRRLLALEPAELRRLGDAGARTVREGHDASGYVEAYRRLLYGVVEDPTALPADLLRR
jgi:glycosyltransferase involved in cell wall biosynthesis